MMKLLKISVLSIIVMNIDSCEKQAMNVPVATISTTPVEPVDPAAANSIGFFLDDWTAKTYATPANIGGTVPADVATCTVTADPAAIITKIPQSIFGTNAVSWMTQMITEPLLMSYLSDYHSHIIRFPGGSISDLYFWNKTGNTIPSDVPAIRLDDAGNTIDGGYWFGNRTDNWTISVDNFYKMLQQTGNQAMITVNYAYARYGSSTDPVASAAHLAADWVRYDKGRTKYWEVGNENFGNWEAGYRINPATNADGQPELLNGKIYGQHFKVFADSMRKAASENGTKIYISAVITEKSPEAYVPVNLRTWNADVISASGNAADFYSVHSYFTPFQQNSNASTILSSVAAGENSIMTYVKSSFSVAGISQKPIALTEWNIFAEGSAQQTSYINGIHALMVMGEGLNNKFGMAARWDLANGWNNGNDMGLFNIGDEPGVPQWNARASYYYMYFFQKTIGDRLIGSTVSGNANIRAYCSSYSGGQLAVALVNSGNSAAVTALKFKNFTSHNKYYWYTLTGGADNGLFSKNVFINDLGSGISSGGPANYATLNAMSALAAGAVQVTVPAYGVVFIMIDK